MQPVSMKNHTKYRPFPPVPLENRQWPNRTITEAPEWVSVDLRDGNQSLEVPMSLAQKLQFFDYLVKVGFRTIEISFPASSDTDFALTRALIEQDRIPDGVAIQVLTQSRDHIIARTFEALRGAKEAVVHLYNSTSTLQRDVVFGFDRKACIDLAVYGAKQIKEYVDADTSGTKWILEYSPESFSGTEMDFAVEICDAVLDVWQPTAAHKCIINLPNTVEMSTANSYADQVEYFCTHTRWRDQITVSLHAHNDRGTATAATELGLLAGGSRVEGCLFGNGERTGNADILNIAMNMYSQGIDPHLDFTHIDEMVRVYEELTGMTVSPRHPYAGKLVYTSFSGSHQDAIKKGMKRQKTHPDRWEVPYLPIDPQDVGRSYEPVIRINSQSGKGGVAFILEQNFGMVLPRPISEEFGQLCKRVSDEGHRELRPQEIFDLFDKEYINVTEPIRLLSHAEQLVDDKTVDVKVRILVSGKEHTITGRGNGLLDGFVNGMQATFGREAEIQLYSQHAMTAGTEALAVSYVQVLVGDVLVTGAGISANVSKSALRAVISAMNRSGRWGERTEQ